jgi:predicted RNA binding protein YcfA (HicA-like mRNA interferase family)
MGRPLKISKIIATANPGVDVGFNAFDTFEAPVLPVGGALNSSQFVGVVGGSNTVDTATYPTVQVRVFITGLSEEDGYIIRQKGSHKFLVGGTTARTALVSGVAYRITTVGDTDWTAYGVYGTAAVGTIFTATAALGDTGTGRVNGVGQCVLTSDLSPTAGNMSVSFFSGATDSTEQAISKLTNKWLQDFTGGETGGNADTGDVWSASQVVNNVRYATNFFSDEGYEVKSGTTGAANTADQQNRVDLAIVQNYNS